MLSVPPAFVLSQDHTLQPPPRQVASYYLTDYTVSPKDETTGWASNMGVVKAGGKTVVCFSRPVAAAAAAKAVPALNEAGELRSGRCRCHSVRAVGSLPLSVSAFSSD